MKNKKVQNILVYTDFTEVGEKSVQWAIYLAKKFKRGIHLVHVINENTYNYFDKSNTKEEVKQTLYTYCETIQKDHNIDCSFYTEAGCNCTIINSEAERLDAFLVVLGTHGKNDPQFLSGASAAKIIRKSRIPYFVVQKNSPVPGLAKNIVLPLGVRKEMKEKTGWVTYFAKNLLTHIDIIYKESNDNRLSNNILFATRFFDKFDLLSTKYEQQALHKKINKIALEYAAEHNCMMLTILTTKNETLLNKIFGFAESTIIANAKGIPVLCINPKKDLYIPCV
ncbi:MAG: universal stress protein [Bacteroidales bacterium]|nr:universal stress protein [Bacteroidales bacterium]MDD4217809.1 universal stress protein [Bacteroidales bacterium]MDY0143985.1 universal stress protein [Bacteroidales bacterium]